MNNKEIVSGFFNGSSPTDKKINLEKFLDEGWKILDGEGSFFNYANGS